MNKAMYRQAIILAVKKWQDMPARVGDDTQVWKKSNLKHRESLEKFCDRYGIVQVHNCSLCCLFASVGCEGCIINETVGSCKKENSYFARYMYNSGFKYGILKELEVELLQIERQRFSDYMYRYIKKYFGAGLPLRQWFSSIINHLPIVTSDSRYYKLKNHYLKKGYKDVFELYFEKLRNSYDYNKNFIVRERIKNENYETDLQASCKTST